MHGLTPWPGVTVGFRGEALKLLRVRALAEGSTGGAGGGAGLITDPARGLVSCGAGTLQLLEVQPANGRRMNWDDFARGRRPVKDEPLTGGAHA